MEGRSGTDEKMRGINPRSKIQSFAKWGCGWKKKRGGVQGGGRKKATQNGTDSGNAKEGKKGDGVSKLWKIEGQTGPL